MWRERATVDCGVGVLSIEHLWDGYECVCDAAYIPNVLRMRQSCTERMFNIGPILTAVRMQSAMMV